MASSLIDVAEVYSSDLSESERPSPMARPVAPWLVPGWRRSGSEHRLGGAGGRYADRWIGWRLSAPGAVANWGRLGRSLAGDPPAASDNKPAVPAPQAEPVAAAPSWTFAPQINLTVQGNVHEPQRLADELLPYLQRMLVDRRRAAAAQPLRSGDGLESPWHIWNNCRPA